MKPPVTPPARLKGNMQIQTQTHTQTHKHKHKHTHTHTHKHTHTHTNTHTNTNKHKHTPQINGFLTSFFKKTSFLRIKCPVSELPFSSFPLYAFPSPLLPPPLFFSLPHSSPLPLLLLFPPLLLPHPFS